MIPSFVRRILGPLRPLVAPLVEALPAWRLKRALNVACLRRCAALRMHPMTFGYLDSGADDERTLRRNQDAFREWDLYYKVLSGVTPESLDTSTTVFGGQTAVPFFPCPTAGNRMFHHRGELAVAKAAKDFGAAYCVSTLATTSLKDLGDVFAGVTDGEDKGTPPPTPPRVFQVYVWRDKDLVLEALGKAREAGFDTIALTVDLSWFGNRERDFRNDFTIPPRPSVAQVVGALRRPAWTWDYVTCEPYRYALVDDSQPAEALASFINDQLTPAFDWDDAKWLLKAWNGRAVIKGVVHPGDAQKALDAGFDAIWVSNHGGRQLDSAPASLDALVAVRAAVGQNAHVLVDGGVQRGSDIAKALALGADGVGLGKPVLFGLAAGGDDGVRKTFDILNAELRRTMGLLGTNSIADLRALGDDLLKRRTLNQRDHGGPRYAPAEPL
mmetsp:Transcript_1667/g.5705  ORF Transcript_1667/g.5705 Transcript_1667/m.5705 type:complete len:441 (-) Transcript_1667:8-1330(-)